MHTLAYPVTGNVNEQRWEPLLVTAQLAEPIVGWRDDQTLDGPLSWGAYLEYVDEHGNDLPPMNRLWAVDFDLPVARWTAPLPDDATTDPRLLTADGAVWGWCTSAPVTDREVAMSGVWVRRKPALEDMSRWSDAKRHHIGLGPLKARNVLHPAGFASEITWSVLGDEGGVRDLLTRVTHLGRLTRAGNGRVLQWSVRQGGSRDGWTNRPMPAAGGFLTAVRAPAHHPSRQVPCL